MYQDVSETGEDELVERARRGDVDAFSELVARHQQIALRVAYPLVGDDAADVVQDALVKAYRNLARFRPGASFRPWLLRIVTNEASNRRRSFGRRERLELRVAARAAAEPSVDDAVLSRERSEELAAALARLSVPDRQVIALRWFSELSEAEMAVALDCAAGTVKSRLSRAMARLREELADG